MSEYLKIYEVGPRDGLQNEPVLLSTQDKRQMISGLLAAGLSAIEVASFVHPKAVPQMADADVVMDWAISDVSEPGVFFTGLVFNERGYERAIAANCTHIAIGIAVSETFSQANTGMSTAKAFEKARKLAQWAKNDGIWTRVYLSTAWVCPFEGHIPASKAIAYCERIWEMDIDELAVADTVGHANPIEVGRLMDQLGRRLDMSKIAVHLHDTQVLGLANTTAAIQAGVRIHDSSIGGLGGCPFAPGAAGNMATEDLVFLAYKLGLGTGVDFRKLWDVVYDVEKMVGRPIGGRIRAWWESEGKLSEEGLLFEGTV